MKSKVEVEERTAKAKEKSKSKAKMTAEQKACLAACKSFDADVERAEYIAEIAECVLRDMCKACDHKDLCEDDQKRIGGLATINCCMVAIASVAVGMIKEGGAK